MNFPFIKKRPKTSLILSSVVLLGGIITTLSILNKDLENLDQVQEREGKARIVLTTTASTEVKSSSISWEESLKIIQKAEKLRKRVSVFEKEIAGLKFQGYYIFNTVDLKESLKIVKKWKIIFEKIKTSEELYKVMIRFLRVDSSWWSLEKDEGEISGLNGEIIVADIRYLCFQLQDGYGRFRENEESLTEFIKEDDVFARKLRNELETRTEEREQLLKIKLKIEAVLFEISSSKQLTEVLIREYSDLQKYNTLLEESLKSLNQLMELEKDLLFSLREYH